jgi:signal transduction histidine kinase
MTEPRLLDRWHRLGIVVRDSIGSAGLLGLALLPGMAGMGADLPEYPSHRPLDALGWALVVLVSLPLALRRRRPVAAVLITGLAFVLYEAIGYPLSAATLGFPFALYALGAHQERGWRPFTIGLVVAYLPFVLVLDRVGSTQTVLQYVVFLGTLVAFWAVGRWMRLQRAAAERHRQDSMALVVTTERRALARELHDVVTHHVTAMVLQADAAGMVLSVAPEQARDGVAAVSGAGREALAELRHLLRVLDAEDDTVQPGPVTGRIEDLVERTRALGQPVSWQQEGRPQAAPGADLAVYRVVQESLTNAAKHAPGSAVSLRLARAGGALTIEVANPLGPGAGGDGTGTGLLGLRERVDAVGGRVLAGADAGRWTVRAELPVPT